MTRFLAVLVYLAGFYGQGFHLLFGEGTEAVPSRPHTECAVSAECDCPGPCQDPAKHHPGSRPLHDHAHCVICQQVFLACEIALPSTAVVVSDPLRESEWEGRSATPFSEFLAAHPTRGPPLSS